MKSTIITRIPATVLVEIVVNFVGPHDLPTVLAFSSSCSQLRSIFEDSTWSMLLHRRNWRGINERYTVSVCDVLGGKDAFKHLYALESEVIACRRKDLRDVPDRGNSGSRSNLTEVRLVQGGLVVDVEYVSWLHIAGYVAYALPVIGAFRYGMKGCLLLSVCCSVLRFITYDAFFDSNRRVPKRALPAGLSALSYGIITSVVLHSLKRFLVNHVRWSALKEDNSRTRIEAFFDALADVSAASNQVTLHGGRPRGGGLR